MPLAMLSGFRTYWGERWQESRWIYTTRGSVVDLVLMGSRLESYGTKSRKSAFVQWERGPSLSSFGDNCQAGHNTQQACR